MFWGSNFPVCIVDLIIVFFPIFVFFKDASKCIKKSWCLWKSCHIKEGCLDRYHEVVLSVFPPFSWVNSGFLSHLKLLEFLSKPVYKGFFCVWLKKKSHEIYPLNKFLRALCSIDYEHSGVQKISRTFHLAWNFILISPPSSSWQPPFYFLLLNLTTLDTSYKWNHAVSVPLWLANFTYHNVFRTIHVVENNRISPF